MDSHKKQMTLKRHDTTNDMIMKIDNKTICIGGSDIPDIKYICTRFLAYELNCASIDFEVHPRCGFLLALNGRPRSGIN